MTVKISREKGRVSISFSSRSRYFEGLTAPLITVVILSTFDSYLFDSYLFDSYLRIFLVLKLLECCVDFCKFATAIKANLFFFFCRVRNIDVFNASGATGVIELRFNFASSATSTFIN